MAAEVIGCHSTHEFEQQLRNAVQSRKLVVINFMASWNGHCRVLAPTFAEIARKTPHVVFLKLDIEELGDVFRKYNVHGMPTLVFLKDGNEVDRLESVNKQVLQAKIAELATA